MIVARALVAPGDLRVLRQDKDARGGVLSVAIVQTELTSTLSPGAVPAGAVANVVPLQ